jgi:ankyrin repeat protein
MVDDSGEAPDISIRPILILNFASMNYHADLIEIALDPSWHKGVITSNYMQELRRLALDETCNIRVFRSLLEDYRAHGSVDITKYTQNRISWAAAGGQADIVQHLIESEGAEVNDPRCADRSFFQCRCPAEFKKGFKARDRADTQLSCAVRAGHANVAKILLDAGADHDHAIEFAAMCGSRELVKILWGRGENKNNAVQGAFAMAVDREDTAMFRLLAELGAKLDDDVRAAAIKVAQEEGRESMVALLCEEPGAAAYG